MVTYSSYDPDEDINHRDEVDLVDEGLRDHTPVPNRECLSNSNLPPPSPSASASSEVNSATTNSAAPKLRRTPRTIIGSKKDASTPKKPFSAVSPKAKSKRGIGRPKKNASAVEVASAQSSDSEVIPIGKKRKFDGESEFELGAKSGSEVQKLNKEGSKSVDQGGVNAGPSSGAPRGQEQSKTLGQEHLIELISMGSALSRMFEKAYAGQL